MTRRTKATPHYRLEVEGWLEEQQTFDFGCVLISLGAVTGLWQLLRGRMVILPFSNPTQVLVSSPHWFPLQPSDYFYNLYQIFLKFSSNFARSSLQFYICEFQQAYFLIVTLISEWGHQRPQMFSTFPLHWPLLAEKRSKIMKSVRTDDQIW